MINKIGGISMISLSDYRVKKYKEVANIDTEEKIDDIRYAIGLVEEEEGNLGESKLGKAVEDIYMLDINLEEKLDKILKLVKQEDGDENKYFDKIDSVMKVNSKEGLTK